MGYTPPWLNVVKGSGVYTIYPPSNTSTDDIIIRPNGSDTYAQLELRGNGSIYIRPLATSFVIIQDSAVEALKLGYVVGDSHYKIESLIDAKDLYLATTGTGVLKFGTYTAGAATDSTGYITIKDAAGNTRKLMVQA